MASTISLTDNLCNICDMDLPSCPAFQTDLQYGDADGNDNVIECPYYKGPIGERFGVVDV